jgi:hypothetical protein
MTSWHLSVDGPYNSNKNYLILAWIFVDEHEAQYVIVWISRTDNTCIMKNIKYHTIGTIAKSNINIAGRGKLYTLTHKYMALGQAFQ